MQSASKNGTYNEHKLYWENRLQGLDTRYLFEGDRNGKAGKSIVAEYRFEVPTALWKLINQYANGGELQAYTILLACLQICLTKYKPEEELVVAATMPLSNVNGNQGQLFPYLLDVLKADTTLKAAIVQTANKLAQTHSHLEGIEFTGKWTTTERSNLAFFSTQTHEAYQPEISEAYDWVLVQDDSIHAQTGHFKLYYNTDLYSQEFVENWTRHFKNVIASLDQLDMTVGEVSIFDPFEKALYLNQFTRGAALKDRPEKTVVEKFETIAKVHAQEAAILYREEEISYSELNKAANALAAHLINEKGLGHGDRVMIYQEKSPYFIICLLAIFKARCVYIPLDAKTPPERVKELANDANAILLITTSELVPDMISLGLSLLAIDAELPDIKSAHLTTELPKPQPDDLAYIIFTSGSTGVPKGVMIKHEGLLNVSEFHVDLFGMKPADRYLQFMSLSFDGSLLDIFTTLLAGSALVIFDKRQLQDKQKFIAGIERHRVSVTTITPSFLSILDRHPLPTIHTLVTAGEAADKQLVFFYAQTKNVYNGYGPTEATVNATIHKISSERDYARGIPIGKPSPGKEVLILNDRLKLVPAGVVGELCLSGDGLALGYLNDPELSAEKFIEHPFEAGKRLYKTGDLACWDSTGDIHFKGRKDDQIKLNGHRINLSEIESRMALYEGVEQAVVLADQSLSKGLVAFVQVKPGDEAGAELIVEPGADFKAGLNQYLEASLPKYMIPGAMLFLHTFPRTANQKVDQKALASLFENRKKSTNSKEAEGVSEHGEILLKQIKRVFGNDALTLDDNFFELGGDSLRAITLSAFLAEDGYECPVDLILDNPVLRELSGKLSGDTEEEAVIVPVDKAEDYTASHAQRRIWTLHQMNESASHAYNVPFACRIEGKLDVARLKEAYEALVQRHEILRTSFSLAQNKVVQKVHEAVSSLIDFQSGEVAGDIEDMLKADFEAPFDLSVAPLLRLRVYRIAQDIHVLSLVAHHVIFDGWSLKIFLKELFQFYKAFDNSTALPEPLPFQYRDYTHWHNAALENTLSEQKDFWHKEFEEVHPAPQIDLDFNREKVQSFEGKTMSFELNAMQSQVIDTLIRKYDLSPYMVFQALSTLLIARYAGQSKVVTGSPFSNREIKGLETQIGFYVNVLPVQLEAASGLTIAEFLQAVKAQVTAISNNQQYPFDLLIEDLGLERLTNQTPLYNVVVTWLDKESDLIEIGEDGWQVSSVKVPSAISKYDLTFSYGRSGVKYTLNLNYNTGLFKESRVKRMWQHLQNILMQMEKGNLRIGEIDLLSKEEKEQLAHFNQSPVAASPYTGLTKAFDQLVEEQPNKVAVKAGTESRSRLQLQTDAEQLATTLAQYRFEPGAVMGVAMTPDYASVASFLGIMKAGMVYVPIDPEDPAERINYMIKDANVQAVITNGAELSGINQDIPTLDFQETLEAPPSGFTEVANHAEDLAYILYTSGTTGKPKGIKISHGALHNFCHFHNQAFGINSEHASLLYSSLTFDASIWELWPYLLAGASLHPLPAHQKLDIKAIIRFITSEKVTHAFLPPVILSEVIAQNEGDYLKGITLHTGGEALTNSKNTGDYKIVNNYGLTENTVIATSTFGEPLTPEIGIGKPFSGFEVHILNQYQQPCPPLCTGEIALAGPSLTSGYLNSPELDQSKLIDNPFGEGKLLRTGDYGYWTEEGNIIFKGRIDNQVQLNGRRVELGEVETTIKSFEGVMDTLVLSSEQGNSHLLTAFYTASSLISEEALKAFTNEKLPPMLVPHHFVALREFPVTNRGKTDLKKLHQKALEVHEAAVDGHAHELSPTESYLCDQISKVLSKPVRNRNISFFDLGADSVAVISFHNRLAGRYPSLKVTDIFTHHNIGQLAAYLDGPDEAISAIKMTAEMAFDFSNEPLAPSRAGTSIVQIANAAMLQTTASQFEVSINSVVISLCLYNLKLLTEHKQLPVFIADATTGQLSFLRFDFDEVPSEEALFAQTHGMLEDHELLSYPFNEIDGLRLEKQSSNQYSVCIAMGYPATQASALYEQFDLVLLISEYENGVFEGSISQGEVPKGLDINALANGLEQILEGLKESTITE